MQLDPWNLYYDGGCNLCDASRLQVEDWAQRADQPLVASPLQSTEALRKGYVGDAMVLETGSEVLYAENAWLRLLTISPWYLRWLFWLSKVPPLAYLMRIGYRIVAANRRKWFGSKACQIHHGQSK